MKTNITYILFWAVRSYLGGLLKEISEVYIINLEVLLIEDWLQNETWTGSAATLNIKFLD